MATSPQTLGLMAYRLLRERIASGALRPGARLSDLVLSREIGISRTPIREAIRQLAADGLVEVVPHQGATVRAPSADELEEMYEIRGLLEGHAAARTAATCSDLQARELGAISAAMAAIALPAGADALGVAETVRQRELDRAFHARILELCGLPRMRRLIEDAGVIARPFEAMEERLPAAEFASACRHHLAIAAAIAAHDGPAAQAAMTAHISEGRVGVRARLAAWVGSQPGDLPEALRPFAG